MKPATPLLLGVLGPVIAAAAGPVIVIVDMDAASPGIQSVVYVAPGATVVPNVAVYVYDPEGTRSITSIGYIGGLDRGIAFGHTPANGNYGAVAGLSATAAAPVNAGSNGFVFPGQDRGFAGAEVQYIEDAAGQPRPMQASPLAPIFRVNIQLTGAVAGDRFDFYLLDMVTVWRGGTGGAFSTGLGFSLDTGGDCVPDQTVTIRGVDPDVPAPVPPAAFAVDYIDGGVGPARVIVGGCYANCDGSPAAPVLNVNDFVCFQNAFAAGRLYANCDGSTAAPVLNVNDFVCYMNRYAAGCP